MTWHDAASVRMKLTVPATQRHHRERAAHARCLAISQVRFLYGLATYSVLVYNRTTNIALLLTAWTRQTTIYLEAFNFMLYLRNY